MDREAPSLDNVLQPTVRRFGHFTFYAKDTDELVAFWRHGLGFRTTDTLVTDAGDEVIWMRCDSDHHGLAVGTGSRGTRCSTTDSKSRIGLRSVSTATTSRRSNCPSCGGPVPPRSRFSISRTYLADLDGCCVEVYADMMQVTDETNYTPIDWSQRPGGLKRLGTAAD